MMAAAVRPLTDRPTWRALRRHYDEMRNVHLRTLFADDPKRGERYTAEAAGLYLDYAKHRVTDETIRLLLALAEESGLRPRIDAMFCGERINVTEGRAVLHTALRAPRSRSIVVDGEDVVPSTASSRRAPCGRSTLSISGGCSGKALAQRIVPELESAEEPALRHDGSTNALIRRYRRQRLGSGSVT